MLSPSAKIMLLSCIEKQRSVKEIADCWDYDYATGQLYRDNSPNQLLDLKLITKIKNKGITYRADIDGLGQHIGFLLKENATKDPLSKRLCSLLQAKMDLYTDFLKQDIIRQKVLSITSVKSFYNNNRTLVSDNFLALFTNIYLSIAIWFMLEEKKNKSKLWNIFKFMLLPCFGRQVNSINFIENNLKIFDQNKNLMKKYLPFYQDFQTLL